MIVRHTCRELCFSEKSGTKFWYCCEGRIDYLQGHESIQPQLLGPEHHTHTTATQDGEHSIVTEPADFIRQLGRLQ